MNAWSFVTEAKRRNVYKVAIAYAVVAQLLAEIATQIFPFFEVQTGRCDSLFHPSFQDFLLQR